MIRLMFAVCLVVPAQVNLEERLQKSEGEFG